MALLDRYPILVWAGAALLGWIVGEVIATDPVVQGYLEPRFGAEGFHYIALFCALVGAILSGGGRAVAPLQAGRARREGAGRRGVTHFSIDRMHDRKGALLSDCGEIRLVGRLYNSQPSLRSSE